MVELVMHSPFKADERITAETSVMHMSLPVRPEFENGELVRLHVGELAEYYAHIWFREDARTGKTEGIVGLCARGVADREHFPSWPDPEPWQLNSVPIRLYKAVLDFGVPSDIAGRLSRADGEDILRRKVYDPKLHRPLPSLIKKGETIDEARTREGIA